MYVVLVFMKMFDGVKVDVFECYFVLFGLVCYGVVFDYVETKFVMNKFYETFTT